MVSFRIITSALIMAFTVVGQEAQYFTKGRSNIEEIFTAEGGAVNVESTLVGKFTRRLIHSVDVYVVKGVSSAKGEFKGLRLQFVSPEPSIAGEILLDTDEIVPLLQVLNNVLSAKGPAETFYISKSGFKVGRFMWGGSTITGYIRNVNSDVAISLDADHMVKLRDLVDKANAVIVSL